MAPVIDFPGAAVERIGPGPHEGGIQVQANFWEEGWRTVSTKDEIKAEFARRLQSRYIAKGWNQSELARDAGHFLPKGKHFGRDSISHYVRAKVLPRGHHLEALAKALGCTTEDLMPVRGRPSVSKTQQAFDFKAGEGNTTWVTINMMMPNDAAKRVYQIVTGLKLRTRDKRWHRPTKRAASFRQRPEDHEVECRETLSRRVKRPISQPANGDRPPLARPLDPRRAPWTVE